MIQIPLSKIVSREDFAKAAEDYRAAIEAHMLGKPGISRPMTHPLLEGLIRRVPQAGKVAERGPDQIVLAEYEFVDDLPPPPPEPEPPSLEQRKALLELQLHQAANTAKAALLSPARLRLLSLDATAAMLKPEPDRSAAELAVIEAFTAYMSRAADIDRATVIASIDIEDLTISTIEGWNPPTF